LHPCADVVERQSLVGVGLGLLPAPARLRLPLASHICQVLEEDEQGPMRGEGDGELEILVGFWLLNTPVLERPIHPNREHRSPRGPDQGGIVQ
jgi:hypothetical protein